MTNGGERERLKVGETRLQSQDTQQQERNPIRAGHAVAGVGRVQRGVDDAASQIWKRQAENGSDEQAGEGSAKPAPIRTQIAEQLQRLPERFPVQFCFWELDPRLVIA